MATKRDVSPAVSTVSLRSRAESETDYEEILSPRPRHPQSPGWLRDFDDTTPEQAPPPPVRVSSPLNPTTTHRHVRKVSLPTLPTSPLLHPSSSSIQHRRPSDVYAVSTLHDARLDSPARRWVRWMGRMHMREYSLFVIILTVVWIKCTVGLGGYSGRSTPPMFGDFEAQRHWLEVTLHLPVKDWYYYDLPYWGLDYPPLTAYVSYTWGYLADKINPSWVALDSSRGIETAGSLMFMRASVVVTDTLIYLPAVVWFTRSWWRVRSRRTQNIALLAIALQPSLILIDNGHFQYNSVMLGLTILSINYLRSGRDLIGAIAFVLSLCFKQMALYYSPAIFAYLLGRCLVLPFPRGMSYLTKIGAVTLLTFGFMFAPFIASSFPSTIIQILIRIFPLGRGLFEDKVANFWCASNVMLKWRTILPIEILPRLATLATLAGISPSLFHVLIVSWNLRDNTIIPKTSNSGTSPRSLTTFVESSPPTFKSSSPTIALLPWSLFNCSMAFFLFSFQVHEKSILLPLMPLLLLMSGRSEIDVDSGTWEWGVLIQNVGAFSIWPLLKKDELGLQYACLLVLWNYVIGNNPLTLAPSFIKYLSLIIYSAISALHMLEIILPPPPRYPDLYPVLNVLLCFGVFGLGWLWGMKKQLETGWGISGLSRRPNPTHPARYLSPPSLAPGPSSPLSEMRRSILEGSNTSLDKEMGSIRSRKKRESMPVQPSTRIM